MTSFVIYGERFLDSQVKVLQRVAQETDCSGAVWPRSAQGYPQQPFTSVFLPQVTACTRCSMPTDAPPSGASEAGKMNLLSEEYFDELREVCVCGGGVARSGWLSSRSRCDKPP